LRTTPSAVKPWLGAPPNVPTPRSPSSPASAAGGCARTPAAAPKSSTPFSPASAKPATPGDTIQRTGPMATTTRQVAEAPVPYHWTLDEYHRAIDAGVFADRRVELLHGEIVEMPPMKEPHIGAVRYLAGLFFRELGWERASSQTPIILPSDGEPEPDIAVHELGAPLKPYVHQVQLVIEVSQSTRQRDLGSKLDDYLRDGLRELWIID